MIQPRAILLLMLLVALVTREPCTCWADCPPRSPVLTGEAYVYGHALSPPYAFDVTDSNLAINGVQVFPSLTWYPWRLGAPCWDSASHDELLARALSLNRALREQGMSFAVRADSVRALLLSDTTRVLYVDIDRPPTLMVLWANKTGSSLHLDGVMCWQQEVGLQQELWGRYLGQDDIVVYCHGWICRAHSEREKRELRDELKRARDRQGNGSGHGTWTGKYVVTAEDAEMFRNPISLEPPQGTGR